MAAAEFAFRRGLGKLLTGISLLLFGMLLALIGYSSTAGPGIGAIVIFVIGVVGLLMAFTGYGEIAEVAPPRSP